LVSWWLSFVITTFSINAVAAYGTIKNLLRESHGKEQEITGIYYGNYVCSKQGWLEGSLGQVG
jgi:hypothetical protein